LAVSLQVTRVINQAVGCHYFPPGPQLPCYQFRCLVNRGTVVVDTVDHQILLSRLNTSFGISDTTLSCFQSYLTNHTSSVRIGRHCFSSVTCTTGVPQGSVLGPLLFTAYVSPIAGIAHLYSIDQQQYADDTQLFISLSPSDYMPDLDHPTRCIDLLHGWFCANGMALNPDKSEAILLGTRQRAHTTPISPQSTLLALGSLWLTI